MASDGDRAKALLTYANYAKVAAALLVSRAAVADWAKGRSVTPYRLRQLEQLLRPDLDTETPPPGWAAALPAEIADEVVRRLGGLPGIVERAAAELGLDGPPPAAPLPEAGSTPPGERRTAPPRQPKRASK